MRAQVFPRLPHKQLQLPPESAQGTLCRIAAPLIGATNYRKAPISVTGLSWQAHFVLSTRAAV